MNFWQFMDDAGPIIIAVICITIYKICELRKR